MEWRQGSTLLQSGGKYTIFKNNGTLHISNLDVTDAGTYTCSVSNQFGIDSQTFNLQVLGELAEKIFNVFVTFRTANNNYIIIIIISDIKMQLYKLITCTDVQTNINNCLFTYN